MQEKKNQHILFTKENTPQVRDRLAKLLKKYPFSLNIRYKHLELESLHHKEVDQVDLRRLSAYAIDRQYLKMKFKKLPKSSGSQWFLADAAQSVEPVHNLPEESSAPMLNDILVTKEPAIESKLLDENSVNRNTNEQNMMMAHKKKDAKRTDQAPEAIQFNDWLDSLKKSKRLELPSDELDHESKSKKKKKKKKKDKKKKAQKAFKSENELEQAEIISETLAELMAKQGYTEKAIEMYNRLSLLFPEKNTYFARKIEDLNK